MWVYVEYRCPGREGLESVPEMGGGGDRTQDIMPRIRLSNFDEKPTTQLYNVIQMKFMNRGQVLKLSGISS